MVFISDQTSVNQLEYPHSHQWDLFVRKHFNRYQQSIDRLTYQLQRVQRLPIVSSLLILGQVISKAIQYLTTQSKSPQEEAKFR
jgi:hypothetical protein